MPSFEIVSEVNRVELKNAVDQSNKEIANRFDFKGSDARIEQAELVLTLYADDDFKLKVQSSIQGTAVRVSGGKKDDLQAAIALVRKSVTDIPLQFQNFRD